MEDSINFVHKLLLLQNNNNEEFVCNFLYNIKLWFNKERWGGNPKINALAIIGPPNRGKKYFFYALVSIVCNVGHIGCVKKSNQFALQDAYNCRIIIGNG